MSTRRLTGPVRLGIVLTVLWLIACPATYFVALYLHPNVLSSNLQWAFEWREGVELVVNGINFQELAPGPSSVVLALSLIPPLLLWGIFYFLPKAIAWIIEGFSKR